MTDKKLDNIKVTFDEGWRESLVRSCHVSNSHADAVMLFVRTGNGECTTRVIPVWHTWIGVFIEHEGVLGAASALREIRPTTANPSSSSGRVYVEKLRVLDHHAWNTTTTTKNHPFRDVELATVILHRPQQGHPLEQEHL
jgi:hypothetical protein